MTLEEIRIRSQYLFLTCARAVDQLTARLAATFPSPPPAVGAVLEKSLKRELGLLFRFWASQQVWGRLDASEEDAKRLNLALLRLFTSAFRLPQDGSGLRYAELLTLGDEVHELSRRISAALGVSHQPLLGELQGAILPWRDAVNQYATDALQLPVERLSAGIKELGERERPGSRGAVT